MSRQVLEGPPEFAVGRALELASLVLGVRVGPSASHRLELANALVEAVQAQNTRAGSKRTYHLVISLHPDDGRLERGELQQVVDRLVDTLGFSEHQYVAVRHNDTDHGHIHVAPFRRQSCRAARRPRNSALMLRPRG